METKKEMEARHAHRWNLRVLLDSIQNCQSGLYQQAWAGILGMISAEYGQEITGDLRALLVSCPTG